jgi:glycolate oxidase FAD binding subunit
MQQTNSRSSRAIDPLLLSNYDGDIISCEGLPQLVNVTSDSLPQYFFSPRNLNAFSQIVKTASQNKWRILPCGSGSKLSWGGLARDIQAVISTQHLNGIVEHAVGDFTVTVEAGMKLTDLQEILKQTKQFLPLDPSYPQSATIGGIIATADAGSWRQRYGGVRDLLLGISFLRADGGSAKAGGRVVKNVAGYDLMKLFAGSYGTLGIITQATFRLYPLIETSGSIVLTGKTDNIIQAANIIRNSSLTPTAAELISASFSQHLGIGEHPAIVLRFQSIPASIDEQINQITKLAQELGLQSQDYRNDTEEKLWQQLTETIFTGSPNEKITCKIGIIPAKAIDLLTEVDRSSSTQKYITINLSSGLGKLRLSGETSIEKLTILRNLCQQNRGFLTVLEAPIEIKQKLDPWGYTGNSISMMQKIKQQFDPQNILSPNRFIGNI